MKMILRNHPGVLRAMLIWAMLAIAVLPAESQRRITPVTPAIPGATPESTTKIATEAPPDLSRVVSSIDADGRKVNIDTVTGIEYPDSLLLAPPPPMEYPLLYEGSAGVNVWDGAMRAFGQKYGLGDAWVELNMHNRYFPVFVAGVGNMADSPVNKNYTFRVPVAPYFKIGASYNFFYNSNPDYKLLAGLRYGFTAFKWSVTDVTVDEGYWNTPSHYSLDNISHTAGYIEVHFGIRVKIWGPISAGWSIIYHSLLHESSSAYGEPMYIPGFGTRKGAVTGNINLVYTIPLHKKPKLSESD
ncbi:MAG: hypothetical protein J1E29_01665 [Duncaniella sp.]|nr:hypothetical protein [Duncaniella sp.]